MEMTAQADRRRTRRARTSPAGHDRLVSDRQVIVAPVAAGTAARELDAEVARLLRVRRGELAEPLGWQRPSLRRQVDAVLAQLQPIRTHTALLSSWTREARLGPDIRLAYAVAWLALDRRVASSRARRRARVTFSPITAHA